MAICRSGEGCTKTAVRSPRLDLELFCQEHQDQLNDIFARIERAALRKGPKNSATKRRMAKLGMELEDFGSDDIG